MSDERFSDLFQDTLSPKTSGAQNVLRPGDKVVTRIAGFSGGYIFLDAGGKSEGLLDAAELRDENGQITVKEGDLITAFFLSQRSGQMVFTTRLGAGQADLAELEDAFSSGIPVQGKVVSEIKGGFQVQIAGQRAFCPYSQMDIRRINDPAAYLDNSYAFKIMEISGNGRNIILSARAVLEEERERKREELQATLQAGDQINGTVSALRDFGAFVDIGGVDGLIPLVELAWGQVEKASDILAIGQPVTVIIKDLDWKKNRIALSLKETTANPWTKAAERYPVGSVHTGTISRLAAFGAFVTLEPGIDGLLHISKLGAGRRINHPREVVEEGQEITVRIDKLDPNSSRISLVPEDFREKECDGEKAGRKQSSPADPKPFVPSPPASLGTLGELLNKQMQKKSRKAR